MRSRLLPALALLLLACGDGEVRGSRHDDHDDGDNDPGFVLPSSAPIAVDCVHTGSGTDYAVGPGQAYESLSEVPFESLGPGDTVRIHFREEPYREKFIVSTSGTLEQPIRICGVASAGGALPVLDANGATTRAELGEVFGDYVSYSMQQTGIAVLFTPEYGEAVQYVTIEGLHFTGTMHAPYHAEDVNDFVDWDGTTRSYDDAAAGIRVQRARHLVIRGNVFEKLNSGLFIISQAYEENHMVRDVLIEGNYFFDNALVEDYNKHQAYIQGTGFVVQFNYFGSPIAGAAGNDLKMRTAGDILRYNYFENGARAIDLIDIEDYVELVMPWHFNRFKESLSGDALAAAEASQAEDWAAYHSTYVYGNIFQLKGENAHQNPIHYGFDNSPYDRRPGTLWFYFNTMVFRTDFDDVSEVRLFDCCSDFEDSFYGDEAVLQDGVLHYVVDGVDYGPMLEFVPENHPRMQAHNNALVLASYSDGAEHSDFEFTRWRADQVHLGTNFVTSGWDSQDLNFSNPNPGYGNRDLPTSTIYPGGNDSHHVTGVENLVTSAEAPLDLATFAPHDGGPLKGAASALPEEIPEALYPTFQLGFDPEHPGRLSVSERDALSTIGAIE